MDKERSEVNNCHVKWKYNSPDINSCQKNRDLKNLSFLMKSMYTVRHILQRHRAELVLLLVLSHLGSVDLSSVGKCPLGQVNHFNLTIDKEFCCVPVHLPKGYGYKSCTENGKSDTIEACLTEPVRLYQWDDTTTASEATCSAEMQCLSEDNMKIEICDESGQSCHTECVCNFLGGYCGTEYFNCNPFPVDCPKEDVQIDCSCRRSTQLPGSESTASLPLPDIMNSINTDTSSKLSSTSDDIMPYGVVLNEEIKSKQNKNTSVLVAGADRLSNASCILIVIVSVASVSTVVGTALCILVYVRKKHSKRSTNHDAEGQKPVGKVKPFFKSPLQDQDEEAPSLQRHVNGQGGPAGQEVEAQTFLPGESQTNMSLNCTSMGRSLFHSQDNIVDQQVVSDDSDIHQTDAKVVVISGNLSGHDVQLRG